MFYLSKTYEERYFNIGYVSPVATGFAAILLAFVFFFFAWSSWCYHFTPRCDHGPDGVLVCLSDVVGLCAPHTLQIQRFPASLNPLFLFFLTVHRADYSSYRAKR